ncbi:B box and SPRY domain-containing protein, partial [Sceloporus undulatus]|uniref:B box and SPRY domain-containing protein n=1 Tax=Sceloporus undulatus TaxID=8520 RepID=UPI001C4B5B72
RAAFPVRRPLPAPPGAARPVGRGEGRLLRQVSLRAFFFFLLFLRGPWRRRPRGLPGDRPPVPAARPTGCPSTASAARRGARCAEAARVRPRRRRGAAAAAGTTGCDPLAQEARRRRDQLVDRCEKLQLQSAIIGRFLAESLPQKSQRLVSEASCAREALIQRLNLVRSACESEEQRLLEAAHSEEERAQQSILTQQAHWTQALQRLEALRTYLVAAVTSTDDWGLLQAEEEIFERMEEAEGILEPRESEKLNFNPRCVQSLLVNRLWAAAALLSRASATDDIHFDKKTASHLLVLSEDKKTLTFSPKKARTELDGLARFDHWPNALAEESFCKGLHVWRVRVSKSGAYKLGVAYGSLQRKGSGPQSRLGHNPDSWVFSRYDKEFQFSHNNSHEAVELLRCPVEIGVLVDMDAGELLFFDPESCALLYAHHQAFTSPLYPAVAVADQSVSLV